MSARRPKASEYMVHQPKVTSQYDHIPSHVKAVMMEPRHNRVIFRKAAEQYAQLQALASALNEEDRQALLAQYPDANVVLGGGVSPQIGSHTASGIGAGAHKLPAIGSAEPSPRAIQDGGQLFAPNPSLLKPEQPQMVRSPRPPRRQNTRPPPRGYGEAPSFSAYGGGGVPDANAPMPRLDDLEAAIPSCARPSEIGGGEISLDASAEEHLAEDTCTAEDGLWEKNPAILSPALMLRTQPIPLLVTRREQALDGLRGVLHALSRIRHSSHRLPSSVSKAYQARLQHAVGWYRVTTTELIERIHIERRQHNPKLMRTPSGELRHVHDPYIVDGANVLLVMGRVDLAFAPLPAASDPLLLQWFSQQHVHDDWASEGGVPETLLAPQAMHSLLELARMQRAHEILLNEAEMYGLSPLPLPYTSSAITRCPHSPLHLCTLLTRVACASPCVLLQVRAARQ